MVVGSQKKSDNRARARVTAWVGSLKGEAITAIIFKREMKGVGLESRPNSKLGEKKDHRSVSLKTIQEPPETDFYPGRGRT